MVCPVCKHDAPYTQAQWDRRQRELECPDINIYPCPECGGVDYMLSTININQPPPPYDGMLANKPQPPRSLWARLLDWWNRT